MATAEVELFVCERYRPMVGWSTEYLLPTDRHPYRARGCKRSWRTLEEAEAALLAPGWVWAATRTETGETVAWERDPTGQQADRDGWSYGANFCNSFEGAAKAGIQMFARWRRFVRTQHFSGTDALLRAVTRGVDELAPREFACPNVDLEGAAHVERMLVEALAAASLYGEWSAPAVARLKGKLAESLAGAKVDRGLDPVLAALVDSQRNVATRMAEAFKQADDSAIAARVGELQAHFSPSEQEAYAVLAIRRFLPKYACPAQEPSHECNFRPVLCPHEGCGDRVSAKALESHDEVCRHKPLACERCSEMVPRGELRQHAAAACPMRDAFCTFAAIGCTSELKQPRPAPAQGPSAAECSCGHP